MDTSRKIGLLLFDYGSEYALELEEGILAFTENNNCTLFEFPVEELGYTSDAYAYQNNAISSLISTQTLDGLLVASATIGNHASYNDLHTLLQSFGKLPLISIGASFPDINSVLSNPAPGLKAQISHLFEKHHCKRPALFSCMGVSQEILERNKVFLDCVKEYGITFSDDDIIKGNFTYRSSMDALTHWAKTHDLNKYDSFVCLNDTMAYVLIDYINEHKYRLSNFCITGFDNVERTAFSRPTLSSVDQRIYTQGYEAAKLLNDLIDRKTIPQETFIDSIAVFRQSCGCVALTDPTLQAQTSTGDIIDNSTIKGVTEWYAKKPELLQIISYQKNTQNIMSLEELKTCINRDLRSFDISGAAICLYAEPITVSEYTEFHLPPEISIFTAYDAETGFDTDNVFRGHGALRSFNPHTAIIPPTILSHQGKLSVVPLYHGTEQFGYFVYRQGSYDPTIYSMLGIIIATIVSSSKVFSLELEKNRLLEETNDNLNRISYTDEMTDILNRRGFLMMGQQQINLSVQLQKTGLVVFGDMDNLKKINDTYGHEAGDRAIISEARMLKKLFRNSDIIGRLGGDEFGIVAAGLDESSFPKIQARLVEMCEEWNRTSGEPFNLSISLGTAPFTSEQSDLINLLKIADARQYEVKRQRRS
ncbi:MAG: GGDEF domain-containing protein [Treponemataceae bacterium]|nr:GGDEF domain-containing protein [Treponemataceae bacterium]